MSWFDEQQQPGGAVQPIEPGYTPQAQPRQRTPTVPVPTDSTGRRTQDANAAPAGGGQAYSDQALQDILHKYPPTNDGMRQAMAEIDRTFGAGAVKLLDHPERLDKLVLPDGRTIDTVMGAGGANPSWGWLVEGGGHGGGGGAAGGGAPGSFGSLLSRPMEGRPLTDDPGFQFRLQEGTKAIERSAAARGTLLTGKTLKDLTRWGQDYASNEFQNAWGRDFAHQGAVFNRLFNTSQLGQQAATSGQQLASGYAGNIANGQIGIGNVQAGATQAGANANANTIGTIGNMLGQWAAGRSGNPDDSEYLDYGRGLF